MGASQCGSSSHLEGKMVSGISMTIVGAICNDSPDYRERCWELCAPYAGKPIINISSDFFLGKKAILTRDIW